MQWEKSISYIIIVQETANTASTTHGVQLEISQNDGHLNSDETAILVSFSSGLAILAMHFTLPKGGKLVVMLSWESKKIGYTNLLKSTIKLAKSAMRNAGVNPDDIGLIVHGGVFREHFRTEPAFATHIQGGLKYCHGIGIDSKSCFAFDVTDGSCSPHVALQSIADLLPALSSSMHYFVLEMTDQQSIVIGAMNHIV